jgi:hypothetical protein
MRGTSLRAYRKELLERTEIGPPRARKQAMASSGG